MARKNLSGYLKHKASGQAIVIIYGKTIYLLIRPIRPVGIGVKQSESSIDFL